MLFTVATLLYGKPVSWRRWLYPLPRCFTFAAREFRYQFCFAHRMNSLVGRLVPHVRIELSTSGSSVCDAFAHGTQAVLGYIINQSIKTRDARTSLGTPDKCLQCYIMLGLLLNFTPLLWFSAETELIIAYKGILGCTYHTNETNRCKRANLNHGSIKIADNLSNNFVSLVRFWLTKLATDNTHADEFGHWWRLHVLMNQGDDGRPKHNWAPFSM